MNTPSILIVDDEPSAAKNLAYALQFSGFAITETAESWEQAEPIMQELSPQLVLLDLVMPGTDGEQALKQIRELYPKAEVFIVTGEQDIQKAVRCIKMGAAEYITKPVQVNLLIDMINNRFTFDFVQNRSLEELIAEVTGWNSSAFNRTEIPAPFEELYGKLKALASIERFYENPRCTLSSLAKLLESNTAYLSKLINTVWQMNVASWIISFRLCAFIQEIQRHKDSIFTIEGIASNCGFASKSTFYTSCRTRFGITPTELVKHLRSLPTL